MTKKGFKDDRLNTRSVGTTAPMDKRYTAEFRRFVNVELNASDKEAFITWASDNNFFDVLEKHCSLGRTIGVKRDFKQNCYIATCLERDSESPNAGLLVSARAGSPDMAQWRLLYILDAIFGEKPWEGLVDISGDRW